MGISYHWLSGVQFRESVVTSTTIGGVLGYGLGIYMVLNGLSFDERYLLKLPKPQFGPQPSASLWKEDKNYMLWNPLEKNQISSGKRLYSNSIFDHI